MNSKEVFSQCFKDYIMDETTLQKLHETELNILKDFDIMCKKYNIQYMLSGGSVLGAIRHNGFIPWDDDIDLMMYREDYNKIDNYMTEMYGDKYVIKSNENDKKFVSKAKKLFLKGSVYQEIGAENFPDEKAIFLDIFPIDNIVENKLRRKIRGKIHDFAYLATGAIYFSRYTSDFVKNRLKEKKEYRSYYNQRKIIGSFLSIFFGFRFYMNIEKKLANYKHKTNFEGIPTGIRYNREVFESGFFKETILHKFEDGYFPIPKNYDLYLKNLYGDYMQIPPVEKREMHVAYKIKFID